MITFRTVAGKEIRRIRFPFVSIKPAGQLPKISFTLETDFAILLLPREHDRVSKRQNPVIFGLEPRPIIIRPPLADQTPQAVGMACRIALPTAGPAPLDPSRAWPRRFCAFPLPLKGGAAGCGQQRRDHRQAAPCRPLATPGLSSRDRLRHWLPNADIQAGFSQAIAPRTCGCLLPNGPPRPAGC